MKKLIAILFLWNFAFAQTTYHVSTTGSDANSGTSGSPWLTLYHAASVVTTSGDIIHIHSGTYIETASVALSVGVNLEGDDSSNTILKSTITANFVPLLNLLSSEGTNGNQYIRNLKFDGTLTVFLPLFIGGRSNVEVYNCSIKDFADRGVFFSGKGDYTDGAPGVYSTGNKFYNNRVLNCGEYQHYNGNYGMGNLNIGGQDGLLVYNNTIIQNQRADGHNGWPIKYANQGHLKNVKIHNNIIIKNKFLHDSNGDGDWDFAVEIWYPEGGFEMYENHIEGAIDMAYNERLTGTYSFWIHKDTLTQPILNNKFQGGIYIERSSVGYIIEDCVFSNLAMGISQNIEDFPPQNPRNYLTGKLIIRRNLMYHIGRSIGDGNNGFGIGMSVGGTGPDAIVIGDSLIIDHNTIVADPNNRPFEGIKLDIPADSIFKFVSITNTVVVGFYDYWLYRTTTSVPYSYFRYKNNLVYGNAAGTAVGGSASITVLDSSGNMGVAPVFTDTSTHNFTPGIGSPLINAGTDGLDIGYTGSNDSLPPTVIAINPTTGATGVSDVLSITISFSKDMNSSTLNSTNIVLSHSGITVSCSIVTGSDYVILTPLSHLLSSTNYDVDIDNVEDTLNIPISFPYNSDFTTGSSPVLFKIKRKLK